MSSVYHLFISLFFTYTSFSSSFFLVVQSRSSSWKRSHFVFILLWKAAFSVHVLVDWDLWLSALCQWANPMHIALKRKVKNIVRVEKRKNPTRKLPFTFARIHSTSALVSFSFVCKHTTHGALNLALMEIAFSFHLLPVV